MSRKPGMIHIYCGDGKGKTTAATGLAVRAAGSGMHVLFARFLKTEDSGELVILDDVENITVLHMKKAFGFIWNLDEEEKEEMKEMYRMLWKQILECAKSGHYEMIVMDEIMAATEVGILTEGEVLSFLKEQKGRTELVRTGRNPAKSWMDEADYISDIQKKKHPFDRGVFARKGIEY